jgi:hypothetical protein
VSFGNTIVGTVLRSPLHGLMSSSTDLIRYTGRRTGRTITTPTQYARDGDDLIILAGRPRTKRWWRNFVGGADMDVLLAGTWVPMRGEALDGAERPDDVAPLVERYLNRFPKANKALDGDSPEERVRRAVLVRCRPRPANS